MKALEDEGIDVDIEPALGGEECDVGREQPRELRRRQRRAEIWESKAETERHSKGIRG